MGEKGSRSSATASDYMRCQTFRGYHRDVICNSPYGAVQHQFTDNHVFFSVCFEYLERYIFIHDVHYFKF